ncbi:MAG: carbon-nitrogen family hydrolase [Thermodesulfovibrionales bacterium]|nr:carbon-nitrogen family hydrolase [Thermodesulfovibrionales bacterium]
MKVALIQMDIRWESKKPNYSKAQKFAKRAREEGCDIAVFPEMFNTGFSMNVPAIAEAEDGETASFLSALAKKYEINLIAGFPVWAMAGGMGRNMAAVFDRQGAVVAKFTKLHPFSFAGEHKHYSPGEGAVVFDIEGIQASLFICYDLRFPEVFRAVAKDVQAIFVIANWPASRVEHWETLLRARAIENQCFIIGVNRTGKGGNGILYPGASHVYGPSGEDICRGNEKDEFLTVEFDPALVAEARSKFPFLKDIRQIEK